jgi:hypothetical protein
MVPIRSVTTAASALVLGKSVARRPFAQIVNESTNPSAQPTPPDQPRSIRKLVDSEQAALTSVLAERALARRRASDGPNSTECRKRSRSG